MNVTPLRKDPIFPKEGNKPHHEVTEANEKNNYHCDEETEHTE